MYELVTKYIQLKSTELEAAKRKVNRYKEIEMVEKSFKDAPEHTDRILSGVNIFQSDQEVLPQKPLGPMICDKNISLSENEIKLLSRGPKYMVRDELALEDFMIELKKLVAKQKIDNAFNEDDQPYPEADTVQQPAVNKHSKVDSVAEVTEQKLNVSDKAGAKDEINLKWEESSCSIPYNCKDKVLDLEKELRDTKCSLEELQEQKDSQSLQMKDSNVLENMLRECEIKYLSTVEELRVAKEQIQQLVVYSEQMRTTNIQMQQMNINNSNTAETVEKVSALNQELATAREQIVTLSSEQEDLLMMLADQEEKVQRFKSRLKDLGENIVSDDEDEVINGDDLT